MQAYLEKFGNNFIVAAFIPSLAFVASVMVVFGPLFPKKLLNSLETTLSPIDGISGIWIFLIAIILGFTLSSLNTFIYKVYEGYFILEKFKGTFAPERNRVKRIKKMLEDVLVAMRDLDVIGIDINSPQYQELLDREYLLRAQLDAQFPPTDHHLLPTRFGNMFKAMEVYPGERYGMDAVSLWPRLVHVIPETHFSRIDQSNNQLAFLINCSILSFAFTAICFCAIGYQFICYDFAHERELAILQQQKLAITVSSTQSSPLKTTPAPELPQPPEDSLLYFIRVNLPAYVYLQRMGIYVALGLIACGLGWFFYRASLPIVSKYSSLVRASFDMFRFDLLKQFNQDLPKTTDDEIELWKKFSKHFVSGYFSRKAQFEYQFPLPPEKG